MIYCKIWLKGFFLSEHEFLSASLPFHVVCEDVIVFETSVLESFGWNMLVALLRRPAWKRDWCVLSLVWFTFLLLNLAWRLQEAGGSYLLTGLVLKEVHTLQTPESQKHFRVRGGAVGHWCIGSIDLDLMGAVTNCRLFLAMWLLCSQAAKLKAGSTAKIKCGFKLLNFAPRSMNFQFLCYLICNLTKVNITWSGTKE